MHFCHYQTFFILFLSTWSRQLVVPYIPGLTLTIAAQTQFFPVIAWGRKTSRVQDTRITSVKHILFISAVKFTWAACFDLV